MLDVRLSSPRHGDRRRRALVGIAVLLAIVLGTAGCGRDDGGADARSLVVVGTEMAFDAPPAVRAGQYEVSFRNDGGVAHELAFRSPAGEVVTRRSVAAGAQVLMSVDLTAGTWELACHELGHYEAGMRKALSVEGK